MLLCLSLRLRASVFPFVSYLTFILGRVPLRARFLNWRCAWLVFEHLIWCSLPCLFLFSSYENLVPVFQCSTRHRSLAVLAGRLVSESECKGTPTFPSGKMQRGFFYGFVAFLLHIGEYRAGFGVLCVVFFHLICYTAYCRATGRGGFLCLPKLLVDEEQNLAARIQIIKVGLCLWGRLRKPALPVPISRKVSTIYINRHTSGTPPVAIHLKSTLHLLW